MYDLRPSLIECFIPDAGWKILFDLDAFSLSYFLNLTKFFFDLFISFIDGHLVDLVDENKDICILVVLFDAAQC